MQWVKFKYQDEKFIYQPLLDAVNKLCADKGKPCLCTSGYRSIEKQKIINADSLKQRKSQGAYQLPNGAVYTGTGADRKCWASAYGQSMHNYCIAMDITDNWFKNLTNDDLKKYALVKSVPYEPWHVTMLSLVGISQKEKLEIRDDVVKGKGEKMGEQTTKIDELEDAVKFLAQKAGIDYEVWYKTAKAVKYLDRCFIKIANAFK